MSATTVRCPACGQRMETEGASRCPLCRYPLPQENQVTGVDLTPYAKALADGTPGWWRMCRWVWSSGAERMKHLALMRASPASARFARFAALWMSVGLALAQGTRIGWRLVRVGPDATGKVSTGNGWVRLVAAPSTGGSELWWNPAQSMIGTVAAFVTGLLVLWLLGRIVVWGASKAHALDFRGEQRVTAAVAYGSAWGVPAAAAGLVCLLRPLAYGGEAARWSWAIADAGLVATAGLVVAIPTVLWWIWLVRLGGTTPPQTRGRVSGFFLVGAPAIAAAVAVGWWWGLDIGFEQLFTLLKMDL